MSDLLMPVTSKTAKAIATFVVTEYFKMDSSKKARCKIMALGNDFRENFLGKVEENIPARTLVVSELQEHSRSQDILALLGDRAETALAHVFELLCDQRNGETGALNADGRGNVVYARDMTGTLRDMSLTWFNQPRGWFIDSFEIGGQHGWPRTSRVVSL